MYNAEDLAAIREEKQQWIEERLNPVLGRHGERQDRFATVSNLEIDRLYTPEDVADLNYEEDLGFPGEEPYTRGVTRRCTAGARGRCASSPDSERRRRQTSAFAI